MQICKIFPCGAIVFTIEPENVAWGSQIFFEFSLGGLPLQGGLPTRWGLHIEGVNNYGLRTPLLIVFFQKTEEGVVSEIFLEKGG